MSAFSDKSEEKIKKMSTNTFSVVFFLGHEKIVCPKKKTKHKHTNEFSEFLTKYTQTSGELFSSNNGLFTKLNTPSNKGSNEGNSE